MPWVLAAPPRNLATADRWLQSTTRRAPSPVGDLTGIMRHVGVDGCKGGWLAVTRHRAGLQHGVFTSICDLVKAFPEADQVLIDVPIGLAWADVPIRPCDRLARKILGKSRRSSVFPVPCREALAASNLASARKINKDYIGRSLGKQTWSISHKIAEIDRFLLADGGHRLTIREVHPEVCFWALTDRKPMTYKKSTHEGREERLCVLRRYEPCASAFLGHVLSETLRQHVQADDVLDATAALITSEATSGKLASLCGDPSHDLAGLPMEMLYLKTWEEVA
jgi:predicted RNase H-like nuclease